MKESHTQLSLAKTHDYSAVEEPKLTVVLIHGIASDSSTFDEALEYLESKESLKDIRFITLDLLGAGKSDKNDDLDYNYHDQLTALHESILALDVKTPLILIGHSLGTLIVTRYAKHHPGEVQELILISPPTYTKDDFKNPAFGLAIKMFKDAIALKDPEILEEKAFKNSMEKIVLNPSNYETLSKLKTPATLIYGARDQIIASHNLPKLLKINPSLTAIETNGKHGVSRDKYTKLPKILERILDA